MTQAQARPSPQDQPALPVGISDDELFGTMLRSAKWTSMPISVCWENTL